MAAKKKARRTTHRSSKGTKLYAVRDSKGRIKDAQSYKRAHGADLKRKAKTEGAAKKAKARTKAKVKVARAKVAKAKAKSKRFLSFYAGLLRRLLLTGIP